MDTICAAAEPQPLRNRDAESDIDRFIVQFIQSAIALKNMCKYRHFHEKLKRGNNRIGKGHGRNPLLIVISGEFKKEMAT